MGRFINADGYVSTGQGILGNNMFAYCQSSPVAYQDSGGRAMTGALRNTRDGFLRESGSAGVGDAGLPIFVFLYHFILALFNDETTSQTENNNETASDKSSAPNKDARLSGEPGTINSEGNKETQIGPDGKAIKERHWTDHGNPHKHTNPHDHNISWDENAHPSFSPPQNYWDGNVPNFP